jgi:DNA-binding NarL/FixJ family response regulator
MDPIPVLLVDDNPTFLRLVTRFLQEYCHGVVVVSGVAHNGEEALVRAQELEPQIILLDLFMPDVSGLEVIPILRTALPEAGIIVLTSHTANGYQDAALAAGADGFVPKARLSTDLLPAIRRVAQAARSQAEDAAPYRFEEGK